MNKPKARPTRRAFAIERDLEHRSPGQSGLMVPALTLGTGTFGGGDDVFKAWGATDVSEATRLVDLCLEAGLTMFNSADVYSCGTVEGILGAAIKGRCDKVPISTKATFQFADGPNSVGSFRYHLTPRV